MLALEQKVGFQLIGDDELRYIQSEWSGEFDFQGRLALDIAARYGRVIVAESDVVLSQCEDDLLEQAAVEAEVHPDLLRRLIELRQRDFPSLDKWGAKKEFESAISEIVRKAATQEEEAVRV